MGLAEGIFSLFLISQPILDWLENAQKWSDLCDLKAKNATIVQIFKLMALCYMENASVWQNLRKKSKPGLAEDNFFTFHDLTAHFRLAGKCSKMVGSS